MPAEIFSNASNAPAENGIKFGNEKYVLIMNFKTRPPPIIATK